MTYKTLPHNPPSGRNTVLYAKKIFFIIKIREVTKRVRNYSKIIMTQYDFILSLTLSLLSNMTEIATIFFKR